MLTDHGISCTSRRGCQFEVGGLQPCDSMRLEARYALTALDRVHLSRSCSYSIHLREREKLQSAMDFVTSRIWWLLDAERKHKADIYIYACVCVHRYHLSLNILHSFMGRLFPTPTILRQKARWRRDAVEEWSLRRFGIVSDIPSPSTIQRPNRLSHAININQIDSMTNFYCLLSFSSVQFNSTYFIPTHCACGVSKPRVFFHSTGLRHIRLSGEK